MSDLDLFHLTFKCSNCGMDLVNLKAANLVREVPKLEDVLLCGGCGYINIVIPSGTKLMSDEEFKALHPDEMADLIFAQKAIQRQIKAQ